MARDARFERPNERNRDQSGTEVKAPDRVRVRVRVHTVSRVGLL